MKEETSCGSGSIFRVRWCNKKQSSQRGVDRRWRGRPRLVHRVDDRLSQPLSRDARFFIYPSLFAFAVYRHNLFHWYLYQQVCREFFYARVLYEFIMQFFILRDYYRLYVWCFNYSVFFAIINWFIFLIDLNVYVNKEIVVIYWAVLKTNSNVLIIVILIIAIIMLHCLRISKGSIETSETHKRNMINKIHSKSREGTEDRENHLSGVDEIS